jgi:hypothetical protein
MLRPRHRDLRVQERLPVCVVAFEVCVLLLPAQADLVVRDLLIYGNHQVSLTLIQVLLPSMLCQPEFDVHCSSRLSLNFNRAITSPTAVQKPNDLSAGMLWVEYLDH